MTTKRIAEVRKDMAPHWVGDGFPVRSLFSYHDDAAAFSPFLLLDYAGPAEFPPFRRGRAGLANIPIAASRRSRSSMTGSSSIAIPPVVTARSARGTCNG